MRRLSERLCLAACLGLLVPMPVRAADNAPSATSPDGKLTAIAKDKSIQLIDVTTQKERATLAGHTEKVTALAFTPDGKALASGSEDKSVRLWDLASGKQLRTFALTSAVVKITCSQDGKTLTVTDDNQKKRTFDLATGKEVGN